MSNEAIQWRNIKKVVKALADFNFGSADDKRWGIAHISLTHSLIAKDGLDVDALGLEPLDSGVRELADAQQEIARLRAALEVLETDAHFIFNNPPGETSQDVRDVIEWFAGSIRVALGQAK